MNVSSRSSRDTVRRGERRALSARTRNVAKNANELVFLRSFPIFEPVLNIFSLVCSVLRTRRRKPRKTRSARGRIPLRPVRILRRRTTTYPVHAAACNIGFLLRLRLRTRRRRSRLRRLLHRRLRSRRMRMSLLPSIRRRSSRRNAGLKSRMRQSWRFTNMFSKRRAGHR